MNASTDRQRTENVVNAISLLKEEGILRFHSEGSGMRGELDVRVTRDGLIDCVIRPAVTQGVVTITRYLHCDSESANALAREILGPETGSVAVAGQAVAAELITDKRASAQMGGTDGKLFRSCTSKTTRMRTQS